MDAVEEIKRRLDLVDYVSRTVPLQRSGRNFKACCPFHSERTPSFYVFPDRSSWRCFGQCADGGDIFSFVEKRDSGTFKDALELLAREAGVELTRRSQDDRDAEERLRAVVEASAAFFQEQLAAPGGAEARAYLGRRGITAETTTAFRLGWAPDEWRRLHDHLGAQGFTKEDMLRAGLVIERDGESSVYDRFRGRVIIPIADERGQPAGFGGRSLGDGQPKYLNSPQTKLFDKGRTLFGLNTARDAIRAEGVAVVVEGYMDVIGPWQAGFRNVVATMGTSLTEQHARMLTRFSKRIVLAMDPDAAGRQAAERAGEIVLSAASVPEMMLSARSASNLSQDAEVDLRVAPLPAGRDPDEITRDDPDLWRRAIAGAQPYVEFLLERWIAEHPAETAVEKRRIIERLQPVLAAVRDPIERSGYVQRLAEYMAVPAQSVADQFAEARRRAKPRREARPADREAEAEPERLAPSAVAPQQRLLAILLRYPELRQAFRGLPVEIFEHRLDRTIFHRWLDGHLEAAAGDDDEDTAASRIALLRGLGDRLPALSAEQAMEAAQERFRAAFGQHLRLTNRAVIDALAEAERTLGATAVERIGITVLEGGPVEPEQTQVAEAVIESFELGRSMHQWDDDEDLAAR